MFKLSSTTNSFGNCKFSPNSPCNSFSKHTDHLGHHSHIKKLLKGTFAHWFLNREKINSEVYNEDHNYLYQNKPLRTFINPHLGTAQPLKIKTYVLIVNKATQIGISKKIQPQKIGLYKIIDTPTLVTYKLEDFSGKQITHHRSNFVPYYSKEFLVTTPPKKPTITKSKSVSFSLDNPDIPSNNESSPYHPVICLKHPKVIRKNTIQETLVFDDNR